MIKKEISCSHCFLGGGYTSKIGASILNKKGENSIILNCRKKNNTFSLDIDGFKISPIPIFPVQESSLFKNLGLSKIIPSNKLDVKYLSKEKTISLKGKFNDKSFISYLLSNEYSRDWINVSIKQWGENILKEEYSEVRKKITRQYSGKNENSRIGYYNGLSVYYHFLKNQKENTVIEYDEIIEININRKYIETKEYKIYFKKLISTIMLPSFLKILEFETEQKFTAQGAYFFYYKVTGKVNTNQIIYDCKIKSPILRLFTVCENILMVQLTVESKNSTKELNVKKRVLELCNDFKSLEFIRSLYLPKSYPIESISDTRLVQFKNHLLNNDIITFGRFGNWEYKDLHELNWHLL